MNTQRPDPSLPSIEPESRYRIPGQQPRCQWYAGQPGQRCREPIIVDMLRGTTHPQWYGTCASHLREINREIRDGQVWWLGGEKYARSRWGT